jgi:LuxR family maltose regulon positive regulatory protein
VPTEAPFGDWMRRRRAELDLTQEQLADQAGCATETIRAIESGRRRPSRDMAERLAVTLRIAPEERDAFVAAARARAAPVEAAHAQGARQPAPTLVATKLFRPRARQDTLTRARLFEKLDRGLAGSLTLIAAPAGFGKTTLVADWLARTALPSAWLALDANDDSPGVFWRYLVAALRQIDPAFGQAATELLAMSDTLPPRMIVAPLLNDLTALAGDVVVVLDDLHSLTNPAIYESLAYLVEHLPPALHLLVLTREDPPLPLARLRARRQLVELRAADLRFTVAEAQSFLDTAMPLALDPGGVAALVGRTEGWIAGLQLAALSLRDLGAGELAAAIGAFAGDNRYVMDYLVDEVIAGQPQHLRDFLVQTAILDRMCGPLCDAVLGLEARGLRLGEDSAQPASSPKSLASQAYSQLILEQLERANLFLVPLDDQRRWYRYHQLFADVLRARLLSGAAPEHVRLLHQRAGTWCAGQGLVVEGVQYALAAHDWDAVVRLIQHGGTAYALGGHIETVLGWLDALPEAIVRDQAFLSVLHAGLLLSTHQIGRAATSLGWADRAIEAAALTATHPAVVQVAAMRSTLARFAGDLPASVELGQAALRAPQPISAAIVSAAHAFLVSGDASPVAERQLAAHLAALEQEGVHPMGTVHPAIRLRSALLLAWMRAMQGRLREAERLYRDAAAAIPGQESGLAVVVGGAAYHAGLGDLLREWNDLDGAASLLHQAIAPGRAALALEPDILLGGVVALARTQQASGEHQAARATLREFTQRLREPGVAPHLSARLAAAEAWIALLHGQLDEAIAWAGTSGLGADDELGYLHEPEYLVLARVWIAQAQRDSGRTLLTDTLRLLGRLLQAAETAARRGSVIEILVLQALGLAAQQHDQAALAALTRALGLAAPEGYLRVFVDAGAPLAALLRQVQEAGLGPQIYVARLLTAFPASAG